MSELSSTESEKTQYSLIVSVMVLFSCLLMTPFQLFGQENESNQISNPNYSEYETSNRKISLLVPSNWSITESNTTVVFSSPLESKSDLFREGLFIQIAQTENIPVNEYASLGIIELRQSLERFNLTHSNATFTLPNYPDDPAYKIIYSYVNGTTNYDIMRIWVVIGRNTYTVSYTAESVNYLVYLPLIETMIGSLRVESSENTGDEPFQDIGGIILRDRPYDLAADLYRNRVYVTDSRANIVSVIDGQKDNILTNIKVGAFPSAIDIDPDSGRVFVANRDSGTVSVIDGSTNAVMANISVGVNPEDVEIDLYEIGSKLLIFVSNTDSGTVSVIDGSTNAVIANIAVTEKPIDLAVNPIINRLYVAHYENNTVSVIDYYFSENEEFRNEIIANIHVGNKPASIDFNPVTNRAYVSNSESDISNTAPGTVSVIDGSTNAVMANIAVGKNPYNVEVNMDENLIYVPNYLSNTVSVIDGSTNQVIHNISVNRFPYVVSYNPANKIAYVTHLTQNIVSMIQNTDPVIGVRFEINPAGSGYIVCDEKEFSNGDYFRYNINTTLDCSAIPNTGFSFSSWSGDLTQNPIPFSQTTFRISKFGNVTSNFIIPVQFTLPKEYWDQLTVILVSIIIPAVVGWSIPAIAGWHGGRKQRRHLQLFLTSLDDRNKTYSQEPVKYSNRFEDLKIAIERALAEGNISESQYGILNNKILEYLESNK